MSGTTGTAASSARRGGGHGNPPLTTIDLSSGAALSAAAPRRSVGASPPLLLTTVMIAIAVCCVASATMSWTHVQYEFGTTKVSTAALVQQTRPPNRNQGAIAAALEDFQSTEIKEEVVSSTKKIKAPKTDKATKAQAIVKETTKQAPKAHSTESQSIYPTLQCKAYGGPSEKEAQEMVYWQEIPSDSHYVSPFHQTGKREPQYLTFEPDGGGWNNIRMAMETVVGLAIATGRTLVIPAQQRMYLLQQDRGKAKTDFSFVDFFPMDQLRKDGLHMITMQEFLERHAMTGHFKSHATGEVSFPPDNVTDWNGKDVKILKEWLRNVTMTPRWKPDHCLAVFPASRAHADAQRLQQMLKELPHSNQRIEVLDTPLPVDATTKERLHESLTGRGELCLYDEPMQRAPVVHFMCSHKDHVRMLVHFYAFLFFEDWREDLWMKRFMRDHMRYVDELQCAAARIVTAMRDKARDKHPNGNGQFDTFHIRRGDFQYKNTRIDAEEIYQNVKDVLADGSTVYIATDERDKPFFEPLTRRYDVYFMDDFKPQLEGVNKNMWGMIDQLVASRGRLFFGCWHSTFTGFINRMRGYHSVREELPGHEDGLLPNSYYYVPTGQKLVLHKYAPLHGAFFNREFPTSWRQLDKGIGNLPTVPK